MTIAVQLQFKELGSSPPKKFFGASTGFEPVASAFMLQCSTSWAMKTHTLEAGQFIEFINPWVHSISVVLKCIIWINNLFIFIVFVFFSSLYCEVFWNPKEWENLCSLYCARTQGRGNIGEGPESTGVWAEQGKLLCYRFGCLLFRSLTKGNVLCNLSCNFVVT